jgi:hypothetical protein
VPIYTCGIGGERAKTESLLQPSGERAAVICPVHGVLAFEGFKPATGTLGERLADATPMDQLQPGKYVKLAAGRWAVRPPVAAAVAMVVGIPITENPDTTLTIKGFLDTAAWRGWLENGTWLEEQR